MLKYLSFIITFASLVSLSSSFTYAQTATPTPLTGFNGTMDATGTFTPQSNGTYDYTVSLSNYSPDCSLNTNPLFRIYDIKYGGGLVAQTVPACASTISGSISFTGFSPSDTIYFEYADANSPAGARHTWTSSSTYIFSDLIIPNPSPTPTNIPTPIPTSTNTPTPTPSNTPTPTFTPTPTPKPIRLTSLSPAKVWIGLKNSDDAGVRFDLLAEAYNGNTLITSGKIDSVPAGISGFNNAKLNTINFNSFSPLNFPSGSILGIKLYVRNACKGSAHNSGIARLWYNHSETNSRFGITIGDKPSLYYLLDNFLLGTSKGSVKKTIDIQSGDKCSPFKPFGEWTITVPLTVSKI